MTMGQTYECPTCHHETHTLVEGECWECRFPRPHLMEMLRQVSGQYGQLYDELGMTR